MITGKLFHKAEVKMWNATGVKIKSMSILYFIACAIFSFSVLNCSAYLHNSCLHSLCYLNMSSTWILLHKYWLALLKKTHIVFIPVWHPFASFTLLLVSIRITRNRIKVFVIYTVLFITLLLYYINGVEFQICVSLCRYMILLPYGKGTFSCSRDGG